MKRLVLAALALLALRADMYPDASNAKNPQALNNIFSGKEGHTYYAQAYGNCTWDHTHDVGQCIQLAVDDANARGGGDVMLPAGKYGMSQGITGKPKVTIRGAGAGAVTGENEVTNCGTEIQALAGFTGHMVSFYGISTVGIRDICLDAYGRASRALSVTSVQGSRFDNLVLSEATEASFVVDAQVDDMGTTGNDFKNVTARVGGTLGKPSPESEYATACRIGEYDMESPPDKSDVHHNNFENLGCFSKKSWSLDLAGADTNKFFGIRLSANGIVEGSYVGTAIFRAGTNLSGFPLAGWARNNSFYGLTSDNTILVEGSDCNTPGWTSIKDWQGSWVYQAVPATCPLNPNPSPKPSRANRIYALKQLGNEPTPELGKDAGLYCEKIDTGGECGNTSPHTGAKIMPAVQSDIASTTLALKDCGSSFNNKGAAGADITFTLPLAGIGNCRLEFNRWAAGKITLITDPADMIRGDGGVTVAGQSIYTDPSVGFASITLEAQAPPGWVVKNYTGVWRNTTAGGVSPAPGASLGRVVNVNTGAATAVTACGTFYNNRPATGGSTQQFDLPLAIGSGCEFEFEKWPGPVPVTVQTAGTDTIKGLNSAVTTAGGAISSTAAHGKIRLRDENNGNWVVVWSHGAWANNAGGGMAEMAGTGLTMSTAAAVARLAVACGTTAGTAKLVAYGGTSPTPVTVLDNIGSGVSGC